MLASITPLGERGRNRTWTVTVGFYLAGSAVGGAALGAGAGLAGVVIGRVVRPPAAAVLVVVAAAALIALGLDAGGRAAVPTVRRQVNEDWLRTYRSWVYGTGFGLQLGAGVVTVVSTAATYLVVLVAAGAAATSAGLPAAVAIGAAFGVARALPILLTARVDTFARLSRLHQRLSSLRAGARRLTWATELLVALAAAGRAAAVVAR